MRGLLRQSHVYVVESLAGDGVKIGVTSDLRARLSQLQTGCPHPLRMAWSTAIWGDAYAVEAEAHAMLDRHRLGGEWFAVPCEVAVAAVSGAAYRLSHPEKSNPLRLALGAKVMTGPFLGFVGAAILAGLWKAGATGIVKLLVIPAVLATAAWISGKSRGTRLIAACLLATCFALAIVSVSLAAEVRPTFPTYDSDAYCVKVAALMGDNPIFKSGCLSNESTARSRLQKVWNEPPPHIEGECLKLMGVGSPNNYQALSGCVAVAVGNYWMSGEIKLAP